MVVIFNVSGEPVQSHTYVDPSVCINRIEAPFNAM